MENMDELLDNIITNQSPSEISDSIKDMLFAKTAERVNSYRPTAANSLFGAEVETAETEEE